MKCELIIEGLQNRQQIWQYCWESDTCVNWNDGTIHAIYYSKQCAREEAKLLKMYYPNIKTRIGTGFNGWLVISTKIFTRSITKKYNSSNYAQRQIFIN